MKQDFAYCKGYRCALKEHCVRYRDGQRIPNDEVSLHWWMEDCGDERIAYIDTKQ